MESARSLEDARTRAEALAVLRQALPIETGLSTWRSIVEDAAALGADGEAAVLARLMVNPPDGAPIGATVQAFCSRSRSVSDRLQVVASASFWRPEAVTRTVQARLSDSTNSIEQFALILCSEVRGLRKHRRRQLLTAARRLDNATHRAHSALHLLSGDDRAFVRWAKVAAEGTDNKDLRRAIQVAIDYSLSDAEFIESIELRLTAATKVSEPEERLTDLLNCVGDLRLPAGVLARAELAIIDAVIDLKETHVQLHYLNEFAMAMIGAAVGDFRVALNCVSIMTSEKQRANGLRSVLIAYDGSQMEHAVKEVVDSIGDPAARASVLSMFYEDEVCVYEEEVLALLASADNAGSVIDQCLHLLHDPTHRAEVVQLAVNRIDEIQSTWRKFRAIEGLLDAGVDELQDRLLDLAQSTADNLSGQDKRDRAAARLIRHLPRNERAGRLAAIVERIFDEPDPERIPQRLELVTHESGLGWIEGL